VRYLLDTNACILLINQPQSRVRNRFDRALAARAEIFLSSVVAFELWYGVSKSGRPAANAALVEHFLSSTLKTIDLDLEDARSAGEVRASLERAGTPIGAYDFLIAGQALRRDLTLVTANVREFRRIDGLKWEDWTRP
jgi:tRNA(fMet)-specific endonuclease VapC